MTQTELNTYKAMLETKKAELSAGLRNREDIAIEKTPDAIDEVQLAGERELAIRNLDRESNMVDGTYARAHQDAAGEKGGSTEMHWVVLEVDSPRKSMPSSTAKAVH